MNRRIHTYFSFALKGKLVLSLLCIFCSFLFSCQKSGQKSLSGLVEEWYGKEILIPSEVSTFYSVSTEQGKSDFKIISFLDSIDCVSCKLHIGEWNSFLETLNNGSEKVTKMLLFLQTSKTGEILDEISIQTPSFSIYNDFQGKINALNHFPAKSNFRTFLLDSQNRVLAIGNPIGNPDIYNLYKKWIFKGEVKEKKTTIIMDKPVLDMGTLGQGNPQTSTFVLKND